jgi:hypothetical protein
MDLEETIEKIEQKLKLINWLKNTKVHIQDFTSEEDTSYIEFKAIDEKDKRKAFRLYSTWRKTIESNCPEISIDYHPSHPHHNDNLKRIWVYTNTMTTPDEKKQALSKVALYFYQILKKEIKYQK